MIDTEDSAPRQIFRTLMGSMWRAAPCVSTVVLLCLLPGSTGTVTSAQAPASAERHPVLEVFVRDGCPHCADAKVFLATPAREPC